VNSTGGYVADIGYTAGFYREMAPSHLAFAALTVGASPGRALRPKRMLELGFGQGFGLSLLAAANPDVAFEGYDFNARHVAHAQRLIDAAQLPNITVSQVGFEEVAARGGKRNLDVIAMHGILSWVSPEAQEATIAIVRQRLKSGGFLYVSYNCLPGWAPLAPIRQLIHEMKRRNEGGSEQQLALALDLLTKLRQSNAPFFAANPAAARHLDGMLRMDPRYLAHEYLDEHWNPLPFSHVAARLHQAGLSYVASATLTENLDQYAVPQNLRPLLPKTEDPVLDETLRDFASNKYFRRDVFARGATWFADGERRRRLSELRFALVVPRSRVVFKFLTPLNELAGKDDLYAPLADALAMKATSFGELLALPQFGESRFGMLLECLTLLVHSGQVLPVLPSASLDAGPAQRFNRVVVDEAREGRIYDSLACPATRTGIPVTDFGLLTLAAFFDGSADGPHDAARHGLRILKRLGRRPLRNSKPIEGEEDAVTFLAEHMAPVIEESIPLWQRLGMF
jgi:SAM-dependent methyltransferase